MAKKSMQRIGRYLMVGAVFLAVSGCTGSAPTSPSSGPSSATLLRESIEFIGANAPSGSTLRLVDCVHWAADVCFKDLQLTFSVRSNREADFANLYAEFLTSDGRVCGDSWADNQALFAGVAVTFRTREIFLKCFDRLPFQVAGVRVVVKGHPSSDVSGSAVPIDLMKQEFSIVYTFAG
jgi:hypothetical protein